jgi:hypothetical protein
MKHFLITALLCLATSAQAQAPEITKVTAIELSGGWRFDVSILHPDTGWDHYADGWRVLDMDGNEL